MSTATMTPPAAPAAGPGLNPRRWTVAEFDRLVEAGLVREGSRSFLWGGEIYEPMSENEPHANALDNLLAALGDRLGRAEWTIRGNHPLTLREGYLPSPDVAVLPGPRSAYGGRRPAASEASLVVEVSDSSYPEDARYMLPEYAQAGVRQFWIVNVPARRVEVYSNPRVADGVGAYDPPVLYGLDAAVPLVLGPAGVAFDPIPVRDILRDSLEPNS